MDGFGRDDMVTPFNYGSVSEAMSDGSGEKLEAKVKRKFWKAKQKVVEKLGREQDHYVIQEDAEIDSYVDGARKLQKSCEQLIEVLQSHIDSLQEISLAENQIGKFLASSSINEHTSLSSTMEKTGRSLSSLSNKRIIVVPKLHQLQHDIGVFMVSAIKDLTKSIEQLEKARTDYRAAMLWLRNASTKLNDPDASRQLTKFREAQGTVKQTKEQYDRLKDDITEKISMSSVSRCSLLSRSLPLYQETVLKFFGNASQELQALLGNFKSCHHHHQYRIKSEEDETLEELMSSLTTADGSDLEDNIANIQPLLDLDNQTAQIKERDISTLTACCYGDSPYQAIDDFSQLKTVQMDSESTSNQTTLECTDCVALPTDDDNDGMWSSKLLSPVPQTEATTGLHLLKLDPSVPLISLMPTSSTTTTTTTTTTSRATPVTVSALPSSRDHTSSSAKTRSSWDELFAGLDPLFNEKV